MVKLFTRIRYLWRRHGPIGFTRLAVYNIVYHARKPRLSGLAAASIDPFDEKYGTDTAGIREIGSLDVIANPAAQSAVRYQPSSEKEVRGALDKLGIDYRKFSFVDFGSGKGRVLLVAAEYPFKEVIGVEFSVELHAVAARNIARFPREPGGAGSIRSVHVDAAEFELPNGDLVCYLYNPFGPPIISSVAKRLLTHHEGAGYHVIVIYVDPRHRAVFEETGMFVALSETQDTLVLATLR